MNVASAFAIHAVGEAYFDQVCHGGQVSQYVERTQVRVMLTSRWDGDRGHGGYYSRVEYWVLVLRWVGLYNVFIVVKTPQDNTLGHLKEGK